MTGLAASGAPAAGTGPSLRLMGQRAAVWMFAGMGAAAALAWLTEAALGVLAASDAVAYPVLVLLALALGLWVHVDPGRQQQALRVAVLAMAAYLVCTMLVWLLLAWPQADYALATFAPWVLCTQLLVYASWPPRVALAGSLALAAATSLPLFAVAAGGLPASDWARGMLPVMGNALLAQLCFGAVLFGLSRQVHLLLQLAPDTGGLPMSARELVERGTDERRRTLRAAGAGQRAKSNFLAVVSHELRTPLGAIQGFVDMVLRSGVGDTQAAALRRAREAAQLLQHRLEQTLEFSRLDEEDDTAPPEQALRLRSLLESALDAVRVAAGERGLAVQLVIESPELDDTDGWLLIDGEGLRRTLDALLDNALRFTQTGGLGLHARRMPGSRGRLEIEVRDSGIGMDPALLPRLLDPFTQAEDALSRSHGGLGLGLALAARRVRRMRGTLGVHSSPGQGTRVCLNLPLQVVPLAARQLIGVPAAGPDGDRAEPDTLAWRRAAPAAALAPADRELLLQLLADHDSSALSVWEHQRNAWSDLLPLETLAQVERSIAAIDFDRARLLLAAAPTPQERP